MRKINLFLILMAMSLTLGSKAAWAQSNISLNGTSSGIVNFTGTGSGNLSLSLGACAGGSNCIDGSASGNGAFGSGGGTPLNGFFIISGASALTLTSTSATSWNITGGTFNFIFSSAADGGGTNFLTGTLSLVNLGQSGSSGTLNTQFVANLTGLSGTLAGLFTSAGGIANISLNLSTSADLSSLGLGTATGTLDHGAITTTPEPGTMVLLGSGLLALGGFLRRQWGQS